MPIYKFAFRLTEEEWGHAFGSAFKNAGVSQTMMYERVMPEWISLGYDDKFTYVSALLVFSASCYLDSH